MADKGNWFKIDRQIFKNPVVNKNNDIFYFWCWLLGHVCYEKTRVFFDGKDTELAPGQLLTTVSKIKAECRVSTRTVRTFLETLKIAKQIDTLTSSQGQVITVLNWQHYQANRQTNRQTTDKRPTNDRQTY